MKITKMEIKRWEYYVGRLILSFGDIELITYKCLAYLPTEHIFNEVVNLPFAKRIELIIALLKSKNLTEKHKNEFIKKLKKSKELAETRNLLAHNPVQVAVYKHTITGDFHFRSEIASVKKEGKGNVLTLQDVRKYAEEVQTLAKELYDIMGYLLKDKGKGV